MANRRDKRPTLGVWEQGGRRLSQSLKMKSYRKLFSQVLGARAEGVRTATGKKLTTNHLDSRR